ncbi:MAG: phosphoglycerate dehydrogenase [Chloroflexi bacterium]|nr:phosphoglycerate dehydrogenase [Chloroflexota bacterium]HCH35592.1 phosphoglycerate dehydrogenase [Dehalococcoidia bacterium]|tara:strand:- start:5735 stop:7360 length:1626 start_codon:yes stop_codon:yes gene_type:complete
MAIILIADPIDSRGVDKLISAGHEVDIQKGLTEAALIKIIGTYDALIVRSETKVTANVIDHAKKMLCIGRAGVGVDNIDVEAATQNGIAVVNAPTGNTIAAAEHAFALMMSLARNIPQADASMRRGEWTRSKFTGVELRNKTLGIIGLGRVGSEVATRARAFQMNILAFDPYVSNERARSLGVEAVPLNRLLSESDFISIHTPLTSGTKSLIGESEFQLLKPGVRIVNAARGGLVDEDLLHTALNDGLVGGAALDVYPSEPPTELRLIDNLNAVLTPHLGASTEEAQAEVAMEVVDQLITILSGGSAPYTVNMPFIAPEEREALSAYLDVATTMGRIGIQLVDGSQLDSITVTVSGEIAKYDTSIISSAALVGILSATSDFRVNLVNAASIASERGIKIHEEKNPGGTEQYVNLVGVKIATSSGISFLGGTSINGRVHLLRLNDFYLDMEPSAPYMLFTSHTDQPGMIGKVGMIAGEYDANISFMEVGREAPRGAATMIVGFDDPVTEQMISSISSVAGVSSVRLVQQPSFSPSQPRLRGT